MTRARTLWIAVALAASGALASFAGGGDPALRTQEPERLREAAREDPRPVFHAGVEAYKEGRFRDALVRFRALSGAYASATVEYNLGNAYYRAGDLGRAVLHWSRALELDPRAGDIRHNLEVVTGAPVHGESVTGYLLGLWAGVPVRTLEAAGTVLLGLALLAFAAGRLGGARVGVALALLLAVAGAGALGWGYGRAAQLVRGARGVVVQGGAATAGPGAEVDYPEVFSLSPGQVVQVHRTSGRYVQVSLPTGAAGWIPRERIERL